MWASAITTAVLAGLAYGLVGVEAGLGIASAGVLTGVNFWWLVHHARIVRDDALMRGILDTTRAIQTEVLAHRGEPRELIERAEAALFKIGHEGGMAEMRTIEAVLHEEIDKLEELSRKDIGLTG